MLNWKGKRILIQYMRMGNEQVMLINSDDNISFIFKGCPFVQYFKSIYIKSGIKGNNYSTSKIYLN